jgi:hypothetical protein
VATQASIKVSRDLWDQPCALSGLNFRVGRPGLERLRETPVAHFAKPQSSPGLPTLKFRTDNPVVD